MTSNHKSWCVIQRTFNSAGAAVGYSKFGPYATRREAEDVRKVVSGGLPPCVVFTIAEE